MNVKADQKMIGWHAKAAVASSRIPRSTSSRASHRLTTIVERMKSARLEALNTSCDLPKATVQSAPQRTCSLSVIAVKRL